MVRKAEDVVPRRHGPFADDVAAAGDGVAVVVGRHGGCRAGRWAESIMPLGAAGGVLGGAAGADRPHDAGRAVRRSGRLRGRRPGHRREGRRLGDPPGHRSRRAARVQRGRARPGRRRRAGAARLSRRCARASASRVPSSTKASRASRRSSASRCPTTSRSCSATTWWPPSTASASDGVDVGARVTTDVAAAQAVLDKLEPALRSSGGTSRSSAARPAATWSSPRATARPTG